jgi:hypothetical protein
MVSGKVLQFTQAFRRLALGKINAGLGNNAVEMRHGSFHPTQKQKRDAFASRFHRS